MTHGPVLATVVSAVSIAALATAAGIAHAEPAVPRVGAPCWPTEAGGALDGAQTVTPQSEALICRKNGDTSEWQRLDRLQLPVETWFTYGPQATLSADEILPATAWVSSPAGAGAVCTAVQASSGGAPPVTHANETPYFRDFVLIPDLETVTISGHCNWRKAWQRVPG